MNMRFTESQKQQSSTTRELLALRFTLENWKQEGKIRNQHVYWVTDSQSAVICIEKGSRKGPTQKECFNIALLATEMKLHITPIHLKREDPESRKQMKGAKEEIQTIGP